MINIPEMSGYYTFLFGSYLKSLWVQYFHHTYVEQCNTYFISFKMLRIIYYL